MEVFLWILFGLTALYLLLSFVFIHLSLDYRRKITERRAKIASLVESQLSILQLIKKEINNSGQKCGITLPKSRENTILLLADLSEIQKQLETYITAHVSEVHEIINYQKALTENDKLIRDEIYRHNNAVYNFNIICDSKIFKPFVLLLRLTKKEKY